MPEVSVAAAGAAPGGTLTLHYESIGRDDHPPIVLVMGSLYLAGDVLARNGQAPS